VHQRDIESLLVELRDTSRSNKHVSKSHEAQVSKRKRAKSGSHRRKKMKLTMQGSILMDPDLSSSKDVETLPMRSNDSYY
jgi:hypothetical protein